MNRRIEDKVNSLFGRKLTTDRGFGRQVLLRLGLGQNHGAPTVQPEATRHGSAAAAGS